MTIDKINSGGFSDKDIKKARRSDAAGTSGQARKAAPDKVRGDRFSPSGNRLGSDFDLAAAELDKLRDSSFASLKEVKRKIDDGAYDRKEVHQKIGSLMEQDLQSVEQLLGDISDKDIDSGKKALSPEYKKYLIENPKVVQKVADQVADDISRL